MSFTFKIDEEITPEGVRIRQFGHVVTTSPAKHGERDAKVQWQLLTDEEKETGLITPTVVEEVWATGNMAYAQYNVFKEPARSVLWIGHYMNQVVNCRSEREVDLIAENAALQWALHRAWIR